MRHVVRAISHLVIIMIGGLHFTLSTVSHAGPTPNNSMADALLMNVGYANAVIEDSIGSGNEAEDFYRFAAEGGRTYVIETFNIPDAPGYAYPLGIRVLNSSGNELVADANGVNGTGNVDARVVFTPTTPGTYFIRVASTQSWTGVYSLRILPKFDEAGAAWDASNDAEPNDVAELAYAMEVGLEKPQTHQMLDNKPYETNSSDVDFYRFAAEGGRTYVIETFNLSAATGYAYPLGIRVLNSSGNELVADANGVNGTGNVDARVVFTPTTPGTYFIRVASTQSWTGVYSLRILPKFDEAGAAWDAANDAEPNDVAELAYTLNVGADQSQTHQMLANKSYEANGSDVDFYHFAAQGGHIYVIETFNLSAATGYAYPLGIRVLNSSGNELVADANGVNGTGNVDARVVFTPTTPDTYFIRVASTQSWTGVYSLRVCEDRCTQNVYLPIVRR